MTTTLPFLHSDPATADEWADALTRNGFLPGETGYRRGQMTFRATVSWVTLTMPAPQGTGGAEAAPGLWKPIGAGANAARAFELPVSMLARDTGADSDDASEFESFLRWAVATAEGTTPAGWAAPSRELVESWLPKGRLTVVARGLVRQGELIHDGRRLALRCPILLNVADSLPELRARWLREVLHDAQIRWRLVRIETVRDTGRFSVFATVDLTGAPEAALESLISMALEATQMVVAWVVGSADFLADADVACRALEVCPLPQQQPQTKEEA